MKGKKRSLRRHAKPAKGPAAAGHGVKTRLAEALEQQAATAEILRVIASSPTDVLPTFEAIAGAATRLCGARDSGVIRFDGTLMHLMANEGFTTAERDALRAQFPRPADRTTVTGRAVLTRAVAHVADITKDPDYGAPTLLFVRAVLSVPMLRDGQPIGAITVTRHEAKPFSASQIALLETFASQAVIAVENVRLFTELQARNRDLTATSEILRVISRSPTDARPVFETIVESAVRVCNGAHGNLYTFDGELLHHAAEYNARPGSEEFTRATFPRRPGRDQAVGRAVLDRAVVHIPDAALDHELSPALVRARGGRSVVAIPLLRDGRPVGAIAVTRPEAEPFSAQQMELLQTFADQAVIAIENVRLFTELQTSNRELTTALEQQTATGEVLAVISSSPTNEKPVFDTIARSSVRLCTASFGLVATFDGELLHLVAHEHVSEEGRRALAAAYPLRPDRGHAAGRAILDRTVIHVPDVTLDLEYVGAPGVGNRATLSVPLLRTGTPIGTITIGRFEPLPFTDQQIALLKTFAEQAVIAIENVRLFKELEARNRDLSEALEQQTATGDILRAISASPTNLQGVLDTVAASAARLCDSVDAQIFRVDGAMLRLAASYGSLPKTTAAEARPISRGSVNGRAVVDRRTVHVHDLAAESDAEFPIGKAYQKHFGHRTLVATPLLREGTPIGAITIRRMEVRPFSDKEIKLLETFADQAVIAIENVRLFTELQTSNRELTTALDTQTATSDILRVISRSQTDVQPVFDAIVASAVRLLRGYSGTLTRLGGDQIELVALTSTDPTGDAVVKKAYPRSLHSEDPHAQAVRGRAPLNISDAQTDPQLPEATHAYARARGWRSAGLVPMLRHDEALGAIGITRREPGGFTDDEIALLQTFADQAVIAIENARLLTELQARTAELTRSVGELTALAEVGRALSSTLDLEAVLQTIVLRANELAGTAGCTIWEYDAGREEFRLRASDYVDEDDAAALQTVAAVTTIRRGQGVTSQVMESRQPVQIHDIVVGGNAENPVRRRLVEVGHRALLAVPLLREDEVLGVLVVTRKAPGAFHPEVVQLLSTFATQSAVAIQNARLFREIEQKSRELEVASQHKSEFLASMSHELRTPLNAIIGFSDVLLQGMFGDTNEKQTEYLRDIFASGQHLLSLINDILDLSKIEAGRMELDLADFHLPSAIDDALLLMRERAGRRGLVLDRHLDDRLGTVHADQRKVKQVLLNLLSNAVKFTPEDGRIEVRAALVGDVVEISVTDTGIGIAPEDQEAVFEEFRQVGESDKKAEGTGLGLALCRKFVELQGGRIWLKSAVGEGSMFTFTLPGCSR